MQGNSDKGIPGTQGHQDTESLGYRNARHQDTGARDTG